jgi:hypothetical protein
MSRNMKFVLRYLVDKELHLFLAVNINIFCLISVVEWPSEADSPLVGQILHPLWNEFSVQPKHSMLR